MNSSSIQSTTTSNIVKIDQQDSQLMQVCASLPVFRRIVKYGGSNLILTCKSAYEDFPYRETPKELDMRAVKKGKRFNTAKKFIKHCLRYPLLPGKAQDTLILARLHLDLKSKKTGTPLIELLKGKPIYVKYDIFYDSIKRAGLDPLADKGTRALADCGFVSKDATTIVKVQTCCSIL